VDDAVAARVATGVSALVFGLEHRGNADAGASSSLSMAPHRAPTAGPVTGMTMRVRHVAGSGSDSGPAS
jgi:hypothetical protein